MDIGKYLSEEIRKCRHRMNLAMAIDRGILCAAAGGIAGIFCEAISLFLPFYHMTALWITMPWLAPPSRWPHLPHPMRRFWPSPERFWRKRT